MNTVLPAQLSLLHRIEPSSHSVSSHPSPSEETGLVSLPGLPRGTAVRCAASRRTFVSVGLRHFLAGSPRRLAESSLRCPASAGLCYGLAVHLPLLSTSPRGDAVTFGYEVQTQLRQGLPPCWFDTLASALVQPSRLPLALSGLAGGTPAPQLTSTNWPTSAVTGRSRRRSVRCTNPISARSASSACSKPRPVASWPRTPAGNRPADLRSRVGWLSEPTQ